MKVFIDTNILISSALFPSSPAKAVQEEEKIRDEKDRPIFRTAITAGADLFLLVTRTFWRRACLIPGLYRRLA